MSEELHITHVRQDKRLASVLVGITLLLVTLRPRGLWGVLFALVGGELVYQGLTGRCGLCAIFRNDTPPDEPQLVSLSDDEVEAAPPKDDVQMTSEQSFPASDPPSFTSSSL